MLLVVLFHLQNRNGKLMAITLDYHLSHYSPMFLFDTPWKRQKTFGFLIFLRGIEIIGSLWVKQYYKEKQIEKQMFQVAVIQLLPCRDFQKLFSKHLSKAFFWKMLLGTFDSFPSFRAFLIWLVFLIFQAIFPAKLWKIRLTSTTKTNCISQ